MSTTHTHDHRPVAPLGRQPALDGMRAFAVMIVMIHHLGVYGFNGGYLGVDVFFALSGFLITTLICEEWVGSDHHFDVRAFYVRRAFRLIPSLLVVLAIVLAVTVVNGDHTAVYDTARDSLASLFYLMNWFFIYSAKTTYSYGQLWSLSVEEQFYLIWPPVLVLMLRSTRRSPLRILNFAIVALAVWTVALILLGASASRIFLGTDTRADMLLIGCAVALARSNDLTGSWQSFMRSKWWLQISPLAAIGGVMLATEPLRRTAWVGWLSGMAVVSLTCLALAALIDGANTPVSRFLSTRPLEWLGQRSYEIYLWHIAVMAALDYRRFGIHSGALRAVLCTVISIAAADATHRLVAPIQRRRPAWATRRIPTVAAVGAPV